MIKDKCYTMGCMPVDASFNTLQIYVCKKCNLEITKAHYEREVEYNKVKEEIRKKEEKKKAEEPTQHELDYYGFI